MNDDKRPEITTSPKPPLSDLEKWWNLCDAMSEDAFNDPDPADLAGVDVAAVKRRVLTAAGLLSNTASWISRRPS